MRRYASALFVGLFAAALGLATLSCNGPGTAPAPAGPVGEPWFADVTDQSGVRFVHDPGPTGSYFFPQIMGSGGALLDYDGDGRLDLYLIHNAGPDSAAKNQLYHQEANGTFTNVSTGSGLDVAGFGMGAACGDVNNDGRVDVLLTEYGRTRLFLNDGAGKFHDVSAEAGIDNPLWGTSAAFLDYDRDGWLDLVVVNYLLYDKGVACKDLRGRPAYCHPSVFPGSVCRLYHNLGQSGTSPKGVRFADVSVTSGLGRLPGPALGVVCADFTGDRWPDIFVANDSKPNHLWVNQKDGTFKEEAAPRGLATNRMGQTEANMGVALGDLDGDALFDILATHLTEETHTFWKQGPRGLFQDRTVAMGLTSTLWRGTGFGAVLADFNHDGALDAAVVNGRVSEPTADLPSTNQDSFWASYAERNQLFRNTGRGVLQDISPANPDFTKKPGAFRGLLCGDLDNDGGLDLVITQIAGPARIMRNVVPNRGHWLIIRSVDPAHQRDACGAEITVEAAGRRLWRQANPGYSYLCSNDPRAHFGLGTSSTYDKILIDWPDGSQEVFGGGAADRIITLKKGDGQRP